jgi:hypothetical protein
MKRRNGGGPRREQRLQFMLSPKELDAVDTFRFEHRMPSRAAAVRELFRLGLASAGRGAQSCAGRLTAMRYLMSLLCRSLLWWNGVHLLHHRPGALPQASGD